MPNLLIQSYFYEALAKYWTDKGNFQYGKFGPEWALSDVAALTDIYTDAQIFEYLLGNYSHYKSFLDQEGFADDYFKALESFGFMNKKAEELKTLAEEKNFTFNHIVKHFYESITNEEIKDDIELSIKKVMEFNEFPTLKPSSTVSQTFTLTAHSAKLTDKTSINIAPENTYLSDSNEMIKALNFLDNESFIEDPSQDDEDIITTSLANVQINPTIINIENIEIESTHDNAKLGFSNIKGAKLVLISGSNNIELSEFNQNGSTEVRLNGDNLVSISGAEDGTGNDIFKLSVENSPGNKGTFILDSAGKDAAIDEIWIGSIGNEKNIVNIDAVGGNYTGVNKLALSGDTDLHVIVDFALNEQIIDAGGLSGISSIVTSVTEDIDAKYFSGLDEFILIDDFGGKSITNLQGSIEVVINESQTGDPLMLNGATERNITLKSTVDNKLTINSILDDKAETLSLSTDDSSVENEQVLTINELSVPELKELNFAVAKDAPLIIENFTSGQGELGYINTLTITAEGEGKTVFTTFSNNEDLESVEFINNGSETFEVTTLNLDGNTGKAGSRITLDGVGDIFINKIQSENTDLMIFNATGDGNYNISDIDATHEDLSMIRTYGSADLEIKTLNIGDTDQTGTLEIQFRGDGSVTIEEFAEGSDIQDNSFKIYSNSSEENGHNEISNASNLKSGKATIFISGNQDLTIGSDEDGKRLKLGEGSADNAVVDASEFTGSLTVYIERLKVGATSDHQTIKLGKGDDQIWIDTTTTKVGFDHFKFVWTDADGWDAGDNIGENIIHNFSAGDSNDTLDLDEAFGSGTSKSDYKLTDFDYGGDSTPSVRIEAQDGEFQGSIVLVGINKDDLSNLDFA